MKRGRWLTLRGALGPASLGCRLRVRVGEARLEMNMENQPCVGDSKPRLPPEYVYRSSTAERKIQAPSLADRAQ